MDLTSDSPFWLVNNGLVASYPPLADDITCDVVVVGAGITGALVAERLTREGLGVVTLDRRDVGQGSTAASTALLQYEIDVPLVELIEKIGREPAQRAYRLSHQSIDDLQSLVENRGIECGFARRTSIYLAGDRKAAKLLAEEARARRAADLDVTYHNAEAVAADFGLPGVAALSTRQAACCNPYLLTHALHQQTLAGGGRVFDRTEVTEFDCHDDGVSLVTNRGPTIRARHAVLATGYESAKLLREKIVNLDNTYAVVSQPLESFAPWNPEWMMWEAKQPYLYLRATSDNRLLVGGEDDEFHSPTRRDRAIPAKAETIRKKVAELLPDLEWEIEYAWAGTFGKTKDGLAYIGSTPEFPSCYFALGFGGNGITFSSMAANLLSSVLKGTQNDADVALFRFER